MLGKKDKKVSSVPRTHPPYAPEYRRRIVELARAGRSVAELARENADLLPERRMEFRIGVNLGDVMVDGEQIYGDG